MWTAEIHISSDDDLVARLIDMRVWLDHQHFEPSTFTYFHLVPGVKVRVSFEIENEAAAFARQFGGTLVHEVGTTDQLQMLSAEAPPTQNGGRIPLTSLH